MQTQQSLFGPTIDKSSGNTQPSPAVARIKSGTKLMLPLFCAAVITGCASVPPPTEQIAVTRNAVDSATSSGGTEFAPLELRSAQDKLAAANQAMARKEYDQARQLAEEAQVDAKLAETKARSTKVQKAVQAAQEGIQVLRDEMSRGTQQKLQSDVQ